MDYIINNEAKLRLSAFLFMLSLIFLIELIFPIYIRKIKSYKRWIINFSFVLINTLILRFLFPILAVSFASICIKYNIGIFNYFNFNGLFSVVVSFLFLDLGIWLQHLLFHKVGFLWRFHKIHHSDEEVDFTTGIRFHPIEIIISMIYKFILIAIIGPSIALVIIFEIILNASSIFNHGNIKIKRKYDLNFRKLIVTPNMHRIHHSEEEKETNSNYGFNFSIWDRVFGTYRENSAKGDDLIVGLEEFKDKNTSSIFMLLFKPFSNK
ncbi:MAG: sterol desaturase family protein [Alphaproteobacteria bacterium]|nr:sterol desaturase family protein [Alphaproteobacteria bacterium]